MITGLTLLTVYAVYSCVQVYKKTKIDDAKYPDHLKLKFNPYDGNLFEFFGVVVALGLVIYLLVYLLFVIFTHLP